MKLKLKDEELLDHVIDNFFVGGFTHREVNEAFSKLSNWDLSGTKTPSRFGKKSLQRLADEGILYYDEQTKEYSLNLDSPYIADRIN